MFSLLAGLWDYFYRQKEYNILILGVEKVRRVLYECTHARRHGRSETVERCEREGEGWWGARTHSHEGVGIRALLLSMRPCIRG